MEEKKVVIKKPLSNSPYMKQVGVKAHTKKKLEEIPEKKVKIPATIENISPPSPIIMKANLSPYSIPSPPFKPYLPETEATPVKEKRNSPQKIVIPVKKVEKIGKS